MIFEKYTNNNNFLIWILLFVIAFGFGKCGNSLGLTGFMPNTCNDNYSYKGHKDDCCYPQKFPIIGNSNGKGFFAGNGIFILLIIALLFICKDDKNETRQDNEVQCED